MTTMAALATVIPVADSQEDTLKSLGFIETEIPDTCQFSPANKRHAPKEIEDGQGRKFQCDGHGYLYNDAGIAFDEKRGKVYRCPCWVRHRHRKANEDYLDSIGMIDARMVKRIFDHKLYDTHALGTVRTLWRRNTHAVLLSGKAGIGKTIACHVIVVQWLRGDPEAIGVFFQAKRLLDEAIELSTADWDSRHEVAARWQHRRELADDPRTIWMIDDLGEEVHKSREGDLAMREMRDLLKRIHHRRGRCAISTNLDGSTVREVYGERVSSRVGERAWIWAHDFKRDDKPIADGRKEAERVEQPWGELFPGAGQEND